MAVGAIVAIVVCLDMCTWFVWPHGGLQIRMAVIGLGFAAFPAAAGVAILRYRLYDIDLVVNRTLVYVTLTVLLAAAYVSTALVLGTALGRGSAWTTAGATLAVALCFRPLRARVQDGVDRRFNRARYDALLRIGEFMDGLRAGRAAPEAIEQLLGELVGDPRLELRLFLPDGELYVDTRGMPTANLPDDHRQQTPIERAGAPVGMVLHQPARPDRPGAARAAGRGRRARDRDRQAAGGVAPAIGGGRGLARPDRGGGRRRSDAGSSAISTTARSSAWCRSGSRCGMPSTSSRAIDRIEPGTRWMARSTSSTMAIKELRELARGLPPAQLEAGLAPALRELAGRAPVPVEVRATAAQLPSGVEAAAYFIACEGLTNAVKHAQASKVVLERRPRVAGRSSSRSPMTGSAARRPSDGSGLSGLGRSGRGAGRHVAAAERARCGARR